MGNTALPDRLNVVLTLARQDHGSKSVNHASPVQTHHPSVYYGRFAFGPVSGSLSDTHQIQDYP